MDRDALQTALLELERSGWDSLCDGTGGDFYGKLMTDDALMVVANGAVMDRDAVIEALRQSPTWRSYDIHDAKLVTTGPDSAALVYVGRAYGVASEPAFVGAMSSVYTRRDGKWRLALYQQTAIPDEAT